MTLLDDHMAAIAFKGEQALPPQLQKWASIFLAHPDDPNFPGTVVRRVSERAVATLQAGAHTYYLKWYQPQSLGKQVKACLRSPAALRAWRCLKALQMLKVPTVLPVGVMIAPRMGVARTSLLITRQWPGTALENFLMAESRSDLRAQMWIAFSGIYARLLVGGYYHGDPSVENFLVDAEGQIAVVDVDGIKRWPILPYWIIFKNLIRWHRGITLQRRRRPELKLSRGECRGVTRQIAEQLCLQGKDLTGVLPRLFDIAEGR